MTRRKGVVIDDELILVGLGANLRAGGQSISSLATCQVALLRLAQRGVTLRRRSGWYVSAPVPSSSQDWYINAVVALDTRLTPGLLLKELLSVESCFGRVRSGRWGARTLDLDLLAYSQVVCDGNSPDELILPHPRILERAFVVQPIAEIAPAWSHPVNGRSIKGQVAVLRRQQRLLALSPGTLEIVGKICDNT